MRRSIIVSIAAIVLVATAASASAALTPIKVIGGPGDQSFPFSDGTSIVWTYQGRTGKYNAFGRPLSGGTTVKLNAAGTRAFTGGVDPLSGRAIIQQVDGSVSDIYFANLATRNRVKVPGVNTRKWEWAPRVSATFVFFMRRVPHNGSLFDDVLLLNRASGRTKRVASYRSSRRSYVALSNVGDRYATWARCAATCTAFVYDAQAKRTRTIPTKNGRPQYAPVVDEANGQLYFVRSGASCGALVSILRVPIGALGTTPTKIVGLPAGIDTGWTLDLATDSGTGNVNAYFQRVNCKSGAGDIYMAPAVNTI